MARNVRSLLSGRSRVRKQSVEPGQGTAGQITSGETVILGDPAALPAQPGQGTATPPPPAPPAPPASPSR